MEGNQSYSICPHCGSEFLFTDNQDSGEFFKICPDCGYFHCKAFKRNADGSFILQDPALPLSFDNLIPLEDKVEQPYGAWSIKLKDSEIADGGSLADEAEFEELKSLVDALKEADAADFAKLSRLVDGEIVVTDFIEPKAVTPESTDEEAESESKTDE